jgi:UDP-glucose 4-epimerase
VADQLLARGHEVAIVDDLSSGKKENVPEGAVFYERDIRDGCAGGLRGVSNPTPSATRPPRWTSALGAGTGLRRGRKRTRNRTPPTALRGARGASGRLRPDGGCRLRRAARVSGPRGSPQYPISPYGVSKLVGKRYLRFYRAQYGLPYAALRYANVYGPRK